MREEKVQCTKNGHIHTPFCPHGTKDSLEDYVNVAISQGFKEISFTEHMPLPDGVCTLELQQESAMLKEDVGEYFAALDEIKKSYEGKIKINKGMEVDYIEGMENKTRDMLDSYGSELEDSVLSVHFLKYQGKYYAVDVLEEFERLLKDIGDINSIYDLYYETLLKSIECDLGKYKPQRIGHPSLVRIFNQKYPLYYKNKTLLQKVIKAIKAQGYQIDFNAAGLLKPYCKETYPSGLLLEYAVQYKIPMVYGSDAHSTKKMKDTFYLLQKIVNIKNGQDLFL